ncbi:MAG: hypothetical protein IR527_00380 [Bacteroides sp.]|nr:MAG: hypothetical protein IR527_00380 [Bacteroides sp.]
MIKISAIKYINSLPFIYGITKYKNFINNIKLLCDNPNNLRSFILNNDVDISLCPTGMIKELNNYNIISNFCISSFKYVKSVILVSNYLLKDIKSIQLDKESCTSNYLLKILLNFYWNKNNIEYKYDNTNTDAYLMIGDKALMNYNSKKFTYYIDLSYEWYKFTKLPFVFALWVGKNNLERKTIKTFNKSLQYGINSIKNNKLKIETKSYYDYIKNNIQYKMNYSKKLSLKLFLKYQKQL